MNEIIVEYTGDDRLQERKASRIVCLLIQNVTIIYFLDCKIIDTLVLSMFIINNKIYTHEIEYAYLLLILLPTPKVFCKVINKFFAIIQIFFQYNIFIYLLHTKLNWNVI